AGNGTNSIFPSNTVKKVAIPSGYEAISSSAFNGCTALTEMAIAGSVSYIGGNAFAGCTNLTSYYIECNPSLVSDGEGDPRIAQNSSGVINSNPVTVYTKSENNNIISYIETTNNRDYNDTVITVKTVADPYGMSTVAPGSGSTPGGSDSGTPSTAPGAEQKGKDGTAIGEGASESTAEKYLTKYAAENDPKGSVFSALQLRAAKAAKTSIKLAWKKAPGAVRFVIYGNKCGKGNRYIKQSQTKATSITIKKIGKNKIKKGTYYKFIVVALDKNGNVVSTSKTVHVATAGGKVGNAKSLSVNAKKNKVSLKVKKTFKLKATAKPASKKLKVRKHRGILFESSNTKVATVNKKGVIKGVKKGSCYIYAYTQNGICKKIKVTVK
ncbi:MAG: leucine-rich repeat protein, partial [Eubacterium sp.]|nr:leucine-rich repeat protein [Eubacterium sp.]